jgi:hypothetical protein
MILTAKQVLNNVIEAKNTAETFLNYAKANKKQTEVDYWQKQIEIFNTLLTKK